MKVLYNKSKVIIEIQIKKTPFPRYLNAMYNHSCLEHIHNYCYKLFIIKHHELNIRDDSILEIPR
jgi:hypothetical protein